MSYLISNDVMLFWLFPLFVIVYRRNKAVFYTLTTILLLLGILVYGIIVDENDITAGPISLESFYTFGFLFIKPYTKFIAISIANFMGAFYITL